MTKKQEAIMLINSLPDDTVEIVVDLLKKLNASTVKENTPNDGVNTLDNLSDIERESVYMALQG